MTEPRMAKLDATTVTTHILVHRKAACGTVRGEPHQWPAGHVWVKIERAYLVSCPVCQRMVPEIRGDKQR